MKRPFAVVGIAYLIAQTVAVLGGLAAAAVVFVLALLCALVFFVFLKNRPAWLIPAVLSCAFCSGINTGYTLIAVNPAQALQGQSVYVTGRVCEAPVCSYGRYYYIIETESVSLESAPQKVKFRLSSGSPLEAGYGDSIHTLVQFNYIELTSPVMRSLMADNVTLTAHLPYDAQPRLIRGDPSLYGWIIDMRNGFCDAATDLLGEELGGLLIGMFTGDTSGIDNTTLGVFRDCGLSHLFAVSGLHLSILIAALMVVLRRIVPDYRATALMAIPFVLFFMAFTGFSMSIRRAGIMTLLGLIAMVVRREADPLNSLGIAALIICLTNPCAAGDVGMLMSFASTLGLITLSAPLNRRIRSAVKFDPHSRWAFILRPLIETISTSVVAAIAVLPITVLCFGEISLVTPIANTMCVYPASAFMIIGALGSALSCIPVIGPLVGFVFFVPAWLIGRIMLILCSMISEIPGAGVSVNYPFMTVLIVGTAGLMLLWLAGFGNNKEKSFSLMLCAALVLQTFMFGTVLYKSMMLPKQSLMVFHADGGLLTALVSGGQCVLVGAGGDSYCGWLASKRLAQDNITDALAIVLPDNTDFCAGNAVDYIEQFEPEAVILDDSGRRFELIEQVCRELDISMYNVNGAELSASGCDISVSAFSDSEDRLWVWAQCGELTLLVCPEGGDCMLLPEEYTLPDVAIVTSDSITNVTCLCSTALIVSAPEDDGGRAEAVLAYRGMKNIFATAEDGCIVVVQDGQGIRVDEQLS